MLTCAHDNSLRLFKNKELADFERRFVDSFCYPFFKLIAAIMLLAHEETLHYLIILFLLLNRIIIVLKLLSGGVYEL